MTGYRRLVRKLGGVPQSFLSPVGLTEDMFEDPNRYVSYSATIIAIERAAHDLRVSDFGFQLAASQNIDILGALAMAMRNASTVRKGIEAAVKHFRFHLPGGRLVIEPGSSPDEEIVSFSIIVKRAPVGIQTTEHAVSMIVGVINLLSQGLLQPKLISFRHQRQSSSDIYKKHLGVVPDFFGSFDGVVVDKQLFRQSLESGNPTLYSIADQYLSSATPSGDQQIDEQLREVLLRLMQAQSGSLEAAAQAMYMHPRTLQRRLSNVSTTFESVRNDVRKTLAENYLRQPAIPLAHIAYALGYADQSILTRNCKKWFGQTPRVFRQTWQMGVNQNSVET